MNDLRKTTSPLRKRGDRYGWLRRRTYGATTENAGNLRNRRELDLSRDVFTDRSQEDVAGFSRKREGMQTSLRIRQNVVLEKFSD